MRYVTFWIPLEYEVDFDLFEADSQKVKTQDLTDEVENSTNKLTLQILDNKNLQISYHEDQFLLTLHSYDRYGYFTYSYTDTIDDELLKIQVYHLFKEFYHIHKNHHDEEDALVEAFISKTYDIKEIKKHYISNYELKFESYESILYEFLEDKSIEDNSFDIDELSNLKEYILKAKNEIAYAKFISKDSDKYALLVSYENNINNLYERLNIIESKKIISSNDKINKWQFFLALLGICLGIVGIYYGYSGATSKNQEVFKTQLSLQTDTIKQNHKNTDEKISNLQNEVTKNQKEIQLVQIKIEDFNCTKIANDIKGSK